MGAYALLVLSGKERPVESDVEKVLAAAGIKAEEGKVAALCAAMKDKDFHAVVAEGLTKELAAPWAPLPPHKPLLVPPPPRLPLRVKKSSRTRSTWTWETFSVVTTD